MQLAGGIEDDAPRFDDLPERLERSGKHDNRDVIRIDVWFVSRSRLQHRQVRVQFSKACRRTVAEAMDRKRWRVRRGTDIAEWNDAVREPVGFPRLLPQR